MAPPQEALTTAKARWNAGDLDGYLQLYDDSIRLHGYAPEPLDKTAVRGFYEAIFMAFEDPHLDFHEVLTDGDTLTVRFTARGRVHGRAAHRAGDRAARHHDPALPGRQGRGALLAGRHARLLVQLGAVPAPA